MDAAELEHQVLDICGDWLDLNYDIDFEFKLPIFIFVSPVLALDPYLSAISFIFSTSLNIIPVQ